MLKKQQNSSVSSITIAFVCASLLLFTTGCDGGSNGSGGYRRETDTVSGFTCATRPSATSKFTNLSFHC